MRRRTGAGLQCEIGIMARIEVILTHSVAGLGAESDHVKVAAGYARNHLIPQGLAIPQTAANKRRLEVLRQRRAERESHEYNTMSELGRSVGKLVLVLKVKTGEDGKLFGSVTASTIVDELKHQFDVTLEKKKVHLEGAASWDRRSRSGIASSPGGRCYPQGSHREHQPDCPTGCRRRRGESGGGESGRACNRGRSQARTAGAQAADRFTLARGWRGRVELRSEFRARPEAESGVRRGRRGSLALLERLWTLRAAAWERALRRT
jgi:large subunit ribosomal protein L9